VHIYTKDKTATASEHRRPVKITILEIYGKSYIHKSVGEDRRNDFGSGLVQAFGDTLGAGRRASSAKSWSDLSACRSDVQIVIIMPYFTSPST
jgi:hypothetical protein